MERESIVYAINFLKADNDCACLAGADRLFHSLAMRKLYDLPTTLLEALRTNRLAPQPLVGACDRATPMLPASMSSFPCSTLKATIKSAWFLRHSNVARRRRRQRSLYERCCRLRILLVNLRYTYSTSLLKPT